MVMPYNLFKNEVNSFDQLRAGRNTAHKKLLVPISGFPFILDTIMQNGYALYKAIVDPPETLMPLREFKRRICEAMVAPEMALNTTRIMLLTTDTDRSVFHVVADAEEGVSDTGTNGADQVLLCTPHSDR